MRHKTHNKETQYRKAVREAQERANTEQRTIYVVLCKGKWIATEQWMSGVRIGVSPERK